MDEAAEIACKWLVYARRDMEAARILLREHYTGESAFHSQQAVEKALKAVLVLHGEMPPKTHNIRRLADHARRHGETPPLHGDEPDLLTSYAVASRYPDFEEEPGREEAEHALEVAERVVEWASKVLEKHEARCDETIHE